MGGRQRESLYQSVTPPDITGSVDLSCLGKVATNVSTGFIRRSESPTEEPGQLLYTVWSDEMDRMPSVPATSIAALPRDESAFSVRD